MNENATPKHKVRYMCVENKRLRERRYYRQEYLEGFGIWGRSRPITVTTFRKKAKEGYEIAFKVEDKIPTSLLQQKQDLDDLIELSLAMKDKAWFLELTARKNSIFVS